MRRGQFHFAGNGTTNETQTLKLDVRNQGEREFSTVRSQVTGRLEVDGVWYRWTGPIDLKGLWRFPSGREYHDIPVSLGSNWWATRERRDRTQAAPPQIPLKLLPGKHTIRFALEIRDINLKPKPQNYYVPSNPVEIETWSDLKKLAEQDGAVNLSQQMRSETNRTSPAAGSGPDHLR